MKNLSDIKNKTIVCWGTYDLGKPRVRILLDSLHKSSYHVIECHSNIWNNIEDKSQVKGFFKKAKILSNLLLSYPKLIIKYLNLPPHDLVFIPYLGVFDILFLSPILFFKKTPVVLDFFVPLYDSIVNDRKLIAKWNPFALLILFFEKVALHFATTILVDTNSHGKYISQLYKIPENRCKRVFVGAEEIFYNPIKPQKELFDSKEFNIFFYGQFIPLQGIDKIVDAAKIIKEKGLNNIKFTIAGIGQTSDIIDKIIKDEKIDNIKRITWIPYTDIPSWINESDICLGIFGDSIKAKSVIPNKVFQILATNKDVITVDSPAIRELQELTNSPLINTIKTNDATLLAEKIDDLYNKSKSISFKDSSPSLDKNIPETQLMTILKDLIY